MEPMALGLLFVFAALFAMLYNYAGPKLMAIPQLQQYQDSYAGKTAVTAGVVFIFLIAVSFAMSFVGQRPKLPAA